MLVPATAPYTIPIHHTPMTRSLSTCPLLCKPRVVKHAIEEVATAEQLHHKVQCGRYCSLEDVVQPHDARVVQLFHHFGLCAQEYQQRISSASHAMHRSRHQARVCVWRGLWVVDSTKAIISIYRMQVVLPPSCGCRCLRGALTCF